MAIICYRDGVMAADTASFISRNEVRIPGNTTKIYRLSDQSLFGGAGKSLDIKKVRDWVEDGRHGPLPSDVEAICLWVWGNGRPFIIDGNYIEEFDGPFFAVGSGASAALGAMWAGKSAEEAVRIAMLVDPYCGGEIGILKVEAIEAQKADTATAPAATSIGTRQERPDTSEIVIIDAGKDDSPIPPRQKRGNAPVRYVTHETKVRGEPLSEIWWSGRQWAVTAYGLEALDGTYPIEKTLLFDDRPTYSWPQYMGGKTWIDNDDFVTSWLIAVALHGPRGKELRNAVAQSRPQDGEHHA